MSKPVLCGKSVLRGKPVISQVGLNHPTVSLALLGVAFPRLPFPSRLLLTVE